MSLKTIYIKGTLWSANVKLSRGKFYEDTVGYEEESGSKEEKIEGRDNWCECLEEDLCNSKWEVADKSIGVGDVWVLFLNFGEYSHRYTIMTDNTNY